ncbi:phytoene dehydrogenase-like protein [Labedella gwakjiensis]|uniref:NAD(P)/FAD-dependent oxidoreductase n=1 Tax=Labedella gwakjiensis TaxID=390269 RepID=A0A2P8GT30_9MICO|nr:NAD(P)/FAD-dependent oxidoreductase [Labedella gwakjiensis]PSL37123.1 phytoene dehydrogenase-like protein [Labedella gwakjiensis]RUQ81974.1 NAD(P)/FAD-dependent oxidoreductase [Labedella gwakjiensis]
MSEVDAVVVGSGPNGLAAAVTLARAGLSVRVFEREATIGGGARTAELTLPGFHHDVCSAVHPMALASGFFRSFRLQDRIELRLPEISYGHPLDGGRAGLAYLDIERTVESLGRDGEAWRSLMAPLSEHADEVARFTGSPILRIPRHPVTVARFGLRALEQGLPTWNLRFRERVAPAMLSGVAAHSIRRMPSLATAGVALALGSYAHDRGWPIPVGGSQAIMDTMAADIRAHGGEIVTNAPVGDLEEVHGAKAVLLDTSPRALLRIAGDRLPDGYVRRVEQFRYGNAVAKVDFALSGPVPWTNTELRKAGTLHVGGNREEIAAAEAEVAAGRHSERPYVLVAQPSILDAGRAPDGGHVLWAYTHVPRGSSIDQTEAITRQIERFAPGFRDLVLASSSKTALEMEDENPNYVLGDIAGGEASLRQLIARPVLALDPWRTPARGVYLASSSTPPGPGVHGLAGWYAARSALRHEFGITTMPSLAP